MKFSFYTSMLLSVMLLSSLMFSSASLAHQFVPLDDFPKWFKDAFARDAKVKKTSKLKIEELGVEAKVKGKVSLAQQDETFRYYVSDIGSDVPVECYLFNEYDGPANSLLAISDASLEVVAEENKLDIASKFNFSLNVNKVENVPYFNVETFYTIGEAEKTLSGIIKSASAELEQGLLICVHNELGYRKAFTTVFESFVTALQKANKNEHFFKNAYQFSLNDIPVGYFSERFAIDADGDVEIRTSSSMLLPVDQSNLSKSDSVDSSWSSPDGSLINSYAYSVNNHEVRSRFSLSYADEKWTSSGELQQKTVNADLKHTGPIVSAFGGYLEIQRLLESKEDSSKIILWSSDANPTGVIEATLTKVKDNPNANLVMDMGPLSMTFLANKQGVLQKGSMAVGGMILKATPLFTEGSPTLVEQQGE